jgi:hypothetical protein
MKNKPMITPVVVDKFDEPSSIGSPNDFVLVLPSSRIAKQQMLIQETFLDILRLYAMSSEITPVEAKWFHDVFPTRAFPPKPAPQAAVTPS